MPLDSKTHIAQQQLGPSQSTIKTRQSFVLDLQVFLLEMYAQVCSSPVLLTVDTGTTCHNRPGYIHSRSMLSSAGHEDRAAGHNADQGAAGDDV